MAMPFFAPNVNSYRRLALGEVAPINVQWGYDNRTCGLRVPMDSPENTRVESRFAGSDANPYLAMAATLACGYLGIERKAAADRAVDRQRAGPGLRAAALAGANRWICWSDCKPLHEPDRRALRAKPTSAVKRKEYETFFRVISSWEREFLLLNV